MEFHSLRNILYGSLIDKFIWTLIINSWLCPITLCGLYYTLYWETTLTVIWMYIKNKHSMSISWRMFFFLFRVIWIQRWLLFDIFFLSSEIAYFMVYGVTSYLSIEETVPQQVQNTIFNLIVSIGRTVVDRYAPGRIKLFPFRPMVDLKISIVDMLDAKYNDQMIYYQPGLIVKYSRDVCFIPFENCISEEECSICRDQNEELRFLCGHKYCSDCILKHLSRQTQCPMCRRNLASGVEAD